jgi:hypothetical protein
MKFGSDNVHFVNGADRSPWDGLWHFQNGTAPSAPLAPIPTGGDSSSSSISSINNGFDGYTPFGGVTGNGQFDLPADWTHGVVPVPRSTQEAPKPLGPPDLMYLPNPNPPAQRPVEAPNIPGYQITDKDREDMMRLPNLPMYSGDYGFYPNQVQAPDLSYNLTDRDLAQFMQTPRLPRQEGPGTAYNVLMNGLGLLGPFGTAAGALGGFATGLTGDHLSQPDNTDNGLIGKARDYLESPGLVASGANWLGRQIGGLFDDTPAPTPAPDFDNNRWLTDPGYRDQMSASVYAGPMRADSPYQLSQKDIEQLMQTPSVGGSMADGSSNPFSLTGDMMLAPNGAMFGGAGYGYGYANPFTNPQGYYDPDPSNIGGGVGGPATGNRTT